MELFRKQYRFRGSHARKVERLTAQFDAKAKAQVFNRNIDVYANAPLVGFLYGRRAELSDEKDCEKNEVYNQNVMGDRVIYSSEELLFNYRLIMLLDEEYEPDVNKRIDKAFRAMGDDPKDMERFDEYVRGGVDVLYEKLVDGEPSVDAFADRLYEFVIEFQNRFNDSVSEEDILSLCQ